MLTRGKSSDQLKLPPQVFARPARAGSLPENSPLLAWQNDQDDRQLSVRVVLLPTVLDLLGLDKKSVD
jgi:hypothetical protein